MKRTVTRLRDNIVKLRIQVGLKIKALLFTQGLIKHNDDKVINKKWLNKKLEEVQKLNYPSGLLYTFNHYMQQWLKFTKDLQIIKKDLLAMQTEEEHKLLSIYKSVPGIADITALKLKDELGNMGHFANEKKLFNYLGLTPIEYSSGENVRYGHISRQGRSSLRCILVEVSWTAIKEDPNLMKIYTRIKNTRGAKKAIVAIAMKLSDRLRTCIKKGVCYEIKSLATVVNLETTEHMSVAV